MATERFNDFLTLRLPDSYRLERSTDEEGEENIKILCDAQKDSDGEWTAALTVKLQLPDKEGEIPEDKRNLSGNFHAGLSANIHEVPALLWTVNALVVAILLEHHRHTCVLACYEAVRSRDELNEFAQRAAEHLNVLLGCVEIDGEAGHMEAITPDRLLELANVAEPLSEEAAQEEEKQRAMEQYAQEHPTGEGMSVRAVYRDPITGKVKRDLFWERAGAESGDPGAMIQMAMAYMNGDGVEQDAEKAAEYMRKAAELDEPTAQFNMGIYYLQGQGVPRDFDQAYEWMQKAKENGDSDADGILYNIENVRTLREKAEQGDLEAKIELAGTLMAIKGEENFRESVALAQEAAEAGSLKAMWILGLAYDHGRGVEQSYETAFEWYLKAAEVGHAPSQANLACLYARGDGVEKDMQKAEEWVRKSAAQGDPDGLRLLRNIDEQAAMDAERAAWEEKWRRQQEEEARQRAAEWMEKYGQYLEKNPRIVINGSKFVFTGVMEDNWPEILEKLMQQGGVERGAVSGKTDYLVVDPRGYGESKVKEALAQRIKGKAVKIVLLDDFLKALGMKKTQAAPEQQSAASNAEAEHRKVEQQREEEEHRRAEAEQQRLARDRAEKERREREAEEHRRKEEAERAEKRKAEEQKAAYEKAVSDWEKETADVKSRRETELREALDRLRQTKTDRINSEYHAAKEAAEKAAAEAQTRHKRAQEELSTLGFFKFSEKSTLKKTLAEAESAIANAKASLEAAENARSMALSKLEGELAREKEKLRDHIETRLPLPKKPSRAKYGLVGNNVRGGTKLSGFQEDIIAFMEPGTYYTAAELSEKVPSVVAAGLSASRVSVMLKQLYIAGWVNSVEDKRVVYYEIL